LIKINKSRFKEIGEKLEVDTSFRGRFQFQKILSRIGFIFSQIAILGFSYFMGILMGKYYINNHPTYPFGFSFPDLVGSTVLFSLHVGSGISFIRFNEKLFIRSILIRIIVVINVVASFILYIIMFKKYGTYERFFGAIVMYGVFMTNWLI
jgi:hypothetical protein